MLQVLGDKDFTCYDCGMGSKTIEEMRLAVQRFEEREGHGATTNLAKAANVSDETIRRFSSKNTDTPRKRTVRAIARGLAAYNIHGDWLVDAPLPTPSDALAEVSAEVRSILNTLEDPDVSVDIKVEQFLTKIERLHKSSRAGLSIFKKDKNTHS